MSDQPLTSSPVVDLALKRFKLAAQAYSQQEQREKDDLACQIPENLWPQGVKDLRNATSAPGVAPSVTIPPRPMISIPTLDQPIQLVLNQERAAHLGVQVHPLSEEADDDTAEVIQGLYRRIEVDSRANLARSWGFERAVKAGRGVYRVLTEYDPDGGHPSDQRIVIKRILHQGSVYLDPFAQEPDWSDGEWAFVVEDMPLAKFKRRFKDSELHDYDNEAFTSLATEHPQWIQGDDEASRTIRVAEYYYLEFSDKAVSWTDADGQAQSRPDKTPTLYWCVINAIEELEPPTAQDGKHIPLIPVIGRELIPFDGDRRWAGIISSNKGAAQLFNYSASGAVEAAALETKASHAVDPEAIEGYEAWWNQKNVRNFPYLPYKRMRGGRDLGPPEPIQADMSKIQANLLLLEKANEFIHTGTGAFEPTLGQNSPNVRTKGATLALQAQHDEGNSNWLDNLAEISLTREAKVVLDLIPFVYDRPGRIARTLDLEDNPQTVMLNAPFVMGQNGRPQQVPAQPASPMPNGPRQVGMGQSAGAAAQGPMGAMSPAPPHPAVKHYDLKKGRYGVTVSVGKAYKSRVEQGADELGQLFQAEPQLFTILGDIYLKFRDFPGHLEASERVKKMLPPQLQDHNDPNNAAQQVPQLQAQVQQLTQQLQQAVEYVKTEQAKHAAQVQIAQVKAAADESIAHINNAAKIEVARISAAKEALDQDQAAKEELLATGLQHAHETQQAALDRAHQQASAEQAHQHAVQQTKLGAVTGAAQSAQEHEQALAQGDQQIGGTMAAQAQQAALQPAPDNGAGA